MSANGRIQLYDERIFVDGDAAEGYHFPTQICERLNMVSNFQDFADLTRHMSEAV